MHFFLRTLTLGSLILGISQSTSAAPIYWQDFDGYANGTTDLGDGSLIQSNNGVASIQSNALRLTEDDVRSTLADFKVPTLSSDITSFTASFDFSLATLLSLPADGFSFSIGNIADGAIGDEEGFGTGLAVEFDTWNNGGEGAENGIGVDVSLSGVTLAMQREAAGADPLNNEFFVFDGAFRPVEITWIGTGINTGRLDVRLDGRLLFDDLLVNGFSPMIGDRFAFGARTGGATELLLIDNLHIASIDSSPVPEPTSMALFGLTALGFGVGFRRRRNCDVAEDVAWNGT